MLKLVGIKDILTFVPCIYVCVDNLKNFTARKEKRYHAKKTGNQFKLSNKGGLLMSLQELVEFQNKMDIPKSGLTYF